MPLISWRLAGKRRYSSARFQGIRERTFTVTVGISSIPSSGETVMNNIIWLIGAIVVVLAILSFLGLR